MLNPVKGALRMAPVARQTLVYVGAMMLSRAMSFVLVPVYTHRLGTAAYGLAELLDTVDLVCIVVASSAVADPFLRHFHDATTPEAKDRVTSTAVLALAGAGALLAAVGAAVSGPAARWLLGDAGHAALLRITFGTVVFQGVVEVPLARLRGTGRPLQYAAWTLARAAIGLALNVALIAGLGLGIRGLVLSTLIASGVTATTLVVLTLRRTGLGFDMAVLRRMVAFGWPLVPGTLALVALQHGRSWVLARSFGLDDVGRWALGFKFGALVTQVVGNPVRSAWSAEMYRVWDALGGRAAYPKALTYLAALYASAAVALSVAAPEVVRAVAPPSFAPAAAVIPAVAWAFVFREVGEFFRGGLVVGGDTRAVAWIEPAVAALDLALGIVIVPRFGLPGAAALTPLVFAIYAAALHRAARKVLGVAFESRRLALLLALGVLLSAASFVVPWTSTAARLGARALLAVAFPLLALTLVFREPAERAAVRALRQRLRWW